MSANTQDYEFDDLDKPGAERSRRRRGEDDLHSDFEEDLLEEDWLSAKKNTSDGSDEELNDDLLQSDDEDFNMTGQEISLNSSSTCLNQQSSLQEAGYTGDAVNNGSEDVGAEGYQQEQEEGYRDEFSQGDTAAMPANQMDHFGVAADDGCQDEVLDIEINEPLGGEFQEEDYQMFYGNEHHDGDTVQQEAPGDMMGEEQHDEENTIEEAQICNTEEVEALPQEETKEESDEEDEEDEESGRTRFKSERKDGVVVRLADAGSKRRHIPETLELSEKAKQDLREFEEQERQKREYRHGGRGNRGGGRGGRGGRGRGSFPGFGMQDYRGGNRGRMNDRAPLMGNIEMQPTLRMAPLHQQPLQSQQHHSSRLRGPSPFQEHGRAPQPLQPLINPHMSHRSSPVRLQMEPPPRMMNSPPPSFPQHYQQQQQQQPPQPKNIHINPHFRGPASSSVQVPLMPPAQSQPRHAVGPQRFPGHGDFEQHMSGNFGQPQRSHHMEPFRSQLPQGPQDREPLFRGDCLDSSRFAGQSMFDHQGPSALMSSSNNLHQQLSNQSHMGFGPPGPGFNQPAQRQLGIFAREPPRSSLSHHQSHQGMMNLNQQGGPPAQPRTFMGPRQPFGQQGNLFPPPQVQFGMQVQQLRGLMHGLPVSQLPHHNPLSSHQPMNTPQQHHRQELPHHNHQQQQNLSEPHPMMHHGQNPFHQQQAHGSPRQMTPRLQSPQQRNMSNRQRMNTPISKQMQQRNSNLRELPIAPGNAGGARPATSQASTNIRPVAKATQVARPGQNPQWRSNVGRGQATTRTESQPGTGGGTAAGREILRSLSSENPQDPDEDEETRQYRLKIEEQKRLREEILKKKEMRRQMQAGVRKKELIERLNSQTNNANQFPSKALPTEANIPQTVQATPPPQQPLKPQQQPLQQRQFPQRTQQQLNHTMQNPNQGNNKLLTNPVQMLSTRANVKSRLQMGQGVVPQHNTSNQQMTQPQQNPNQQNMNTIGAPIPTLTIPQHNIPVHPPDGLAQGLKAGAKRTVMQRAKNLSFEGQQVPQKVRVVKLSGATGINPEATTVPIEQQGTWPAPLFNHDAQRTVTMVEQPQAEQGGAPQANRADNPPQNRVVMPSRGRGRGGSQAGRGRPMATRQGQRSVESERCTVSIEGLSSSTTDNQLRNLLRSIGPIEMFQWLPQQRKAVAKFSSHEHAANFQTSFHRHMIDLSHIDVSLIDG
ncbi:RNA-binding protein 33 isoform X2 [Gouania willdenowi]|uniref:RNA-binding protein 33 isoform X2 n=1 Tax=Gouania willdenowi TaxID=441366 RepID=UPI001055459B|nr:RNA-binding protein 33 isoform X2 [Gouania willdenowi]